MRNAEGITASSGGSTPSITATNPHGVDLTTLLSYNQLPIQDTETAAPTEGVIMPESATTSADWLVSLNIFSPDLTECVVGPGEVLQLPDTIVTPVTASNGHDHEGSTALNDAPEAATVLASSSRVETSVDEEATDPHTSTTSIPTAKETDPGEAVRQVEEPRQSRHMDAPPATAFSQNDDGRSAIEIVWACVDWNLRTQEDLNRLTESGLITVTPSSGISGPDLEIHNIDLSTLDVEDLVKHRDNGLITITVSVGPRTPNATELATLKTSGLLEFNSPMPAVMALLSELETDHQSILQSASSTTSKPIATEIMLQSSPQSESATAWGAIVAEKMYQSAQKILLMHESAYKQAEITARIALEILCEKLGTDVETFQEERRIVSVYQGVMDAGKNGANGEMHRGAITARVQQEDTLTGLHLDNKYALRKFKAAAELERRKVEKEREEAARLAKEERAGLAQEAAATALTTSVQWIPVLPITPTVPNITLHCERCQEDAQLSTNDPGLPIPILRLTPDVTTPHTCAKQPTGVETAPPCNSDRTEEDVSAQVSVENANEMPTVPVARDSGAHTASKPSYVTVGGPIGATAFRSSNSRVTTDKGAHTAAQASSVNPNLGPFCAAALPEFRDARDCMI